MKPPSDRCTNECTFSYFKKLNTMGSLLQLLEKNLLVDIRFLITEKKTMINI